MYEYIRNIATGITAGMAAPLSEALPIPILVGRLVTLAGSLSL
jgi:hypothetical protein